MGKTTELVPLSIFHKKDLQHIKGMSIIQNGVKIGVVKSVNKKNVAIMVIEKQYQKSIMEKVGGNNKMIKVKPLEEVAGLVETAKAKRTLIKNRNTNGRGYKKYHYTVKDIASIMSITPGRVS